VRPIWDKMRRMGLTEECLDAVIEEARAQSRS